MLYVKVHRSYRDVIAVCDTILIGKRFEEGIRQLEVKEHFFKGTEMSLSEAVTFLKKAQREDATINFVGSEAIQAGRESLILNEEDVITIENIPFALVLL